MITVTSLCLIAFASTWGVGDVRADPTEELIVQIVSDTDDQELIISNGVVYLSDDMGDVGSILFESPGVGRRMMVGSRYSPGALVGGVYVAAGPDQKAGVASNEFIIQTDSDPTRPVIGVRCTPIPAPLAAHLERDGLMIANISEGSPADEAGLKRYDVVVSFGGRGIVEMDDLLEAIRENGAGNAASVVLIRGGEEHTVKITPVEFNELGSWPFKFEEPEEGEPEVLQKYFGHRVLVGPEGKGLIKPYGRLDRLPDDIKEMLEKMPDIEWSEGDVGVWGQPDASGWKDKLPLELRIAIGEEDADAQVSVDITCDGETIRIHRSEEGAFTVEREDADGNRSSAVYEDEDELRAEDQEAYETYRRVRQPRKAWTWVTPSKLKDLDLAQRKFQIELKGQLEKAREQLKAATKQAREAHKRFEIEMKKVKEHDARDVQTRTETVMIRIDDDGRITVELEEDGVSRKYEFDCSEDFRKSEPELYERFKKHLKGT